MRTLCLIVVLFSLPVTAWAQDTTSAPGLAAPETAVAAPAPMTYPTPQRTRRRSMPLVVTGAVMIPTGALMLIVSMPFWLDGLDLLPNSTPGTSASD